MSGSMLLAAGEGASGTASGWFLENPLYDPKGQPIVVPEWDFPGRGRVQAQLTRAKTVLTRTGTETQPSQIRPFSIGRSPDPQSVNDLKDGFSL